MRKEVRLYLNQAQFQDDFLALVDYYRQEFFLSTEDVLDSSLRLKNENAYFQADFRLINKVNNY